jgi:hypothetical protein
MKKLEKFDDHIARRKIRRFATAVRWFNDQNPFQNLSLDLSGNTAKCGRQSLPLNE